MKAIRRLLLICAVLMMGVVLYENALQSPELPDGSNDNAINTITTDGSYGNETAIKPNRVEVPDLKGMDLETAITILDQQDLNLGVVTQEYSQDILEGLILSQDPKSDEQIEKDGTVDVVISKGLKVAVPGITDEEIRIAIIGGKEAVYSVFTSGDMTRYDPTKNYIPIKDELNSPEKVKTLLCNYYTEGFASYFIEDYTGLKYIDGIFSIPLGNHGIWPMYDQLEIKKREESDNDTIKIFYLVPSEFGNVHGEIQFKYEEGDWKIFFDSIFPQYLGI